jgi:hypothetical protein
MISWSYTLFHIILGAIAIIVYAILQFYIIPELVEHDKKTMAASYTNYSLTILLSVLSIGSVVANWLSGKKSFNKAVSKGFKKLETVPVA